MALLISNQEVCAWWLSDRFKDISFEESTGFKLKRSIQHLYAPTFRLPVQPQHATQALGTLLTPLMTMVAAALGRKATDSGTIVPHRLLYTFVESHAKQSSKRFPTTHAYGHEPSCACRL